MRKLIAALFCLPGLAAAGTGTFLESGVLTTVPGYGYQLKGSYTSNVGDVAFSGSFNEVAGSGKWDRFLAVGLVATPTVPASATQVQISLGLDIKFIDLATGEAAFPPIFSGPVDLPATHAVLTQGTGFGQARIVQSSPAALRFSSSSFTQSLTIADQNKVWNPGGTPVGSASALCYSSNLCENSAVPPNTVHMDFTASFVAGHYLSPSLDPSCASLDCMTPGRDSLELSPFSVRLQVHAVPEPSSYALFAVGLVGLLAYSRRRSA